MNDLKFLFFYKYLLIFQKTLLKPIYLLFSMKKFYFCIYEI